MIERGRFMLTHFNISQQGSRHIEKNIPCQDFSASKRIFVKPFNCEMVLAAIADGVGSCEYSQFGSEIAVQSFMECVEFNIQSKISKLSDENIIKLIKHSFNYALSQIEKESMKREISFVEFDTTLTGIVYDGHTLWFGHIGDDGVVILYVDGEYEMITKRHKGDEVHSLFPLREVDLWQFGKSSKEVASFVLMTDGVLDYCVDVEKMNNRVYFPFLEPALTTIALTDEDAEKQRLDWDEYLSGKGDYSENFRNKVTDDISFVMVQNPDLIKTIPLVQFDFDKWDEDTAKRKKELDDALYADYRAYKAGNYRSPINRATGFCSRGNNIPSAIPKQKHQKYLTVSSSESIDISSNQIEEGDVMNIEESDIEMNDVYFKVIDMFKNVFKLANDIGKLIYKYFTEKRKKNM